MPTRWLVRLAGPRPRDVNLSHLHAVVSSWFDLSDADHTSQVKSYSVSAPRLDGSHLAIEIGTLTYEAELCLVGEACAGREVRFGQHAAVVAASAEPIAFATWDELAQATNSSAWALRFETPTSFRQGRRASPWPAPSAVLRGLAQKWDRWGDVPLPALTPREVEQVWVSDVDGASHVLRVGQSVFSGFVGGIRYQCDDPRLAALVGPLFALAPFTGVGSATTKGLGTVRLERTWQPATAKA